ncbi:hypothetical protein DOTSEDRAFT_74481 [Dothistroma septosporum NZE10]|uniref:Uncharacterized protein n=1 Tax=Dothistroma septosporum (strain NZE10 / CBS 128990) TaxID=675120 RepID=N1PHA6_DOTSN|nr:hypothetical protein DOTSEDRAFT_74481 [Dothistroma septosporum NZE10]
MAIMDERRGFCVGVGRGGDCWIVDCQRGRGFVLGKVDMPGELEQNWQKSNEQQRQVDVVFSCRAPGQK